MTSPHFYLLSDNLTHNEWDATMHLLKAISGLAISVDSLEAAVSIYEENILLMDDRQSTDIHQRAKLQTKALVGARAGALSIVDFKRGFEAIVWLLDRCPAVKSKIDETLLTKGASLFDSMFPNATGIRDSAAHISEDNSTPYKTSLNRGVNGKGSSGSPNPGPIFVGCIDGNNRYHFTRRGEDVGYEVSHNSVEALRLCLDFWHSIFASFDPFRAVRS